MNREEKEFFPDCLLRDIICKMKTGDTVGFSYRNRHYDIKRDE